MAMAGRDHFGDKPVTLPAGKSEKSCGAVAGVIYEEELFFFLQTVSIGGEPEKGLPGLKRLTNNQNSYNMSGELYGTVKRDSELCPLYH